MYRRVLCGDRDRTWTTNVTVKKLSFCRFRATPGRSYWFFQRKYVLLFFCLVRTDIRLVFFVFPLTFLVVIARSGNSVRFTADVTLGSVFSSVTRPPLHSQYSTTRVPSSIFASNRSAQPLVSFC